MRPRLPTAGAGGRPDAAVPAPAAAEWSPPPPPRDALSATLARAVNRRAVARSGAQQRTGTTTVATTEPAPLRLRLRLRAPETRAETAPDPDPDPDPGGSSTQLEPDADPRGPARRLEPDPEAAADQIYARLRDRLDEVEERVANAHKGSRFLAALAALHVRLLKAREAYATDPQRLRDLSCDVNAASRYVFEARREYAALLQHADLMARLTAYAEQVRGVSANSIHLREIRDLQTELDLAWRDDFTAIAGLAERVDALADIENRARATELELARQRQAALTGPVIRELLGICTERYNATKHKNIREKIEDAITQLSDPELMFLPVETVRKRAQAWLVGTTPTGGARTATQRAVDPDRVAFAHANGRIYESAFVGLSDDHRQHFINALIKGAAPDKKATGIKKLKGVKDGYELKLLGAYGATRIYGKRVGGVIEFRTYSGKH